MHVLALNPGSSTLKYRLYDLGSAAESALASGTVDHVADDSVTRAAEEALKRLGGRGADAVGCRVVHGGERFAEPTLVTPEVLAAIRELGRLAPLHNPVAAAVLEAIGKLLP